MEPTNAALEVHLHYIREAQDRTNEHLRVLNGRTGKLERTVDDLKRDVEDVKVPPFTMPIPPQMSLSTGQKAAAATGLTFLGAGAVDMLTHGFKFAMELLKAMGK